MSVAVEIRDVRKVYASQAGPVEALSLIDLEIEAGRFVSLVGPSGCGKSTLLLMIAGLLSPTSGSITISGNRVVRPQTDIGMVFQGGVLADSAQRPGKCVASSGNAGTFDA